jgi:hypothetical protein
VLVEASPKFHSQELEDPLERSLKVTVSGESPAVTEPVKSATGAGGAGYI